MSGELPSGVRQKLHGPTPFGWRDHDELPGMIVEVPEEQAALQQAFSYIDRGCTVAATARWLSITLGRRVDQKSLRRFNEARKKKEASNADQT